MHILKVFQTFLVLKYKVFALTNSTEIRVWNNVSVA